MRDRYKTLRSCVLTCKAWSARSRANLYQRVRFRQSQQIDLFVRSLETNPELGGLVHDLHITPAQAHSHGFFDFAQPNIIGSLTAVTTLQIRQFDWGAQPAGYCDTVRNFTSITSLEVANAVFTSAQDFVALAQSLPQLTKLSCGLNRFMQSWTARESELLWVVPDEEKFDPCPKLTSLMLWVSNF